MVAEGEKYPGGGGSVHETIPHRDELSATNIDPVVRRAGRFKAVYHPIAHRVVEQFHLDVAVMAVCRSPRAPKHLFARGPPPGGHTPPQDRHAHPAPAAS